VCADPQRASSPTDTPQGTKPSLSIDAATFVYSHIALIRASHSLEEALVNARPAVRRIAMILAQHLKAEDFFDRLLLGGGRLLMLDGLDEVVSREDRGRVRAQVESLLHDIYPETM
jgi:hypothetical protein